MEKCILRSLVMRCLLHLCESVMWKMSCTRSYKVGTSRPNDKKEKLNAEWNDWYRLADGSTPTKMLLISCRVWTNCGVQFTVAHFYACIVDLNGPCQVENTGCVEWRNVIKPIHCTHTPAHISSWKYECSKHNYLDESGSTIHMQRAKCIWYYVVLCEWTIMHICGVVRHS